MKTSTIVWIIVVVIILLGGWYWYATMQPVTSADDVGATTETSTVMGTNTQGAGQTNTGQETVPPVMTVATDPTLGSYLVAANGMTLYTYTKDTAGVSNCTGTCAVNWPPYTTLATEPLVGGTGITGEIATTRRSDATVQVTYKGMPLYFWKSDTKAGDTTGNKVGGVWFVVKP